MAQIDSYRLDAGNYPFRIEIPTRYGDLDTNGHLNNVALAGFFEDGRVRFQREIAGGRWPVGTRGLVVSVKIDYLAEGFYPAPVLITAGFGAAGRSSWRVLGAAFQDERCIAVAESVFVRLKDDKPAPIDEEWRAIIAAKSVVTA